eukprot:Nk52_evm14s274 gene=Nk52_evmTU14s274
MEQVSHGTCVEATDDLRDVSLREVTPEVTNLPLGSMAAAAVMITTGARGRSDIERIDLRRSEVRHGVLILQVVQLKEDTVNKGATENMEGISNHFLKLNNEVYLCTVREKVKASLSDEEIAQSKDDVLSKLNGKQTSKNMNLEQC